MVLGEISNLLEKRRIELIDMLENKEEVLELEKQHQIYGAINEIELFLQTISYYEKSSSEKSIEPIKLSKPQDSKKDLISRMFDGIKEKVSKNK